MIAKRVIDRREQRRVRVCGRTCIGVGRLEHSAVAADKAIELVAINERMAREAPARRLELIVLF